MENPLIKVALTNGLILLGLQAFQLALSYFVPSAAMFSIFFGVITFIAGFVLVVRGQLQYQRIKKDMSFGEALLLGFLIYLIPILVVTPLSFLLLKNEFSTGGFGGEWKLYAILGSVLFSAFLTLIMTMITAQWRLFEKAGHKGWKSLIPIYNLIIMTEIAQKPGWWVAMMFIPFVNFVFAIMLLDGLSKAFGKESGFTVGLVLLSFIFFPLLAFGKNYYQHKYIQGEMGDEDEGLQIEDHMVT